MNYKLEILKSEDKNVLVLSSENVIHEKRLELDENSIDFGNTSETSK